MKQSDKENKGQALSPYVEMNEQNSGMQKHSVLYKPHSIFEIVRVILS